MASRNLPPADLVRGVRSGDRAMLARAITLIESKRADHRRTAHQLVQELLPLTGKASVSASPARRAPANRPRSTCSAPT